MAMSVIKSDGRDILVATLVGKMWHLPGPFRGRTLCGFEITSAEVPLKSDSPHCRKCVRAEIVRLKRIYGEPGMTAGEFEKHIPEQYRSRYWIDKIEEYFQQELSESA